MATAFSRDSFRILRPLGRGLFLLWLLLAFHPVAHAVATKEWVEVRAPHFIVATNEDVSEARRVALEMEGIRSVFQTAFPRLLVDAGKPMVIVALKDENSMKAFLPRYWDSPDSVKPAGVYFSQLDRNYAALRLDSIGRGNNPFEVLFHEYTHGVIALNFGPVPVWLNEGLACYYGNTLIKRDGIELGRVNERWIGTLRSTTLIPIEELMKAGHESPHYRKREQAPMFYAQSWALVHFLMHDPEAVTTQLLGRYLQAMNETSDPELAARKAFGDLKDFGSKLLAYFRKPILPLVRLASVSGPGAGDWPSRSMSAAEGLALQGEFLLMTGCEAEARPLILKAIELDGSTASAHVLKGIQALRAQDFLVAEQAFLEAARLDPSDFRAPFYLASTLRTKVGLTPESAPEITKRLERALQLNPVFAPALAALSSAYLAREDTRGKALKPILRAVEVEPGFLRHRVDLGEVLVVLNRLGEARALGTSLAKDARTSQEHAMVKRFLDRLSSK